MSLAILFLLLCAQHVSDINISIVRSLQLFCSITTMVVLFLVRCVLEFRCGWDGVLSVLQQETSVWCFILQLIPVSMRTVKQRARKVFFPQKCMLPLLYVSYPEILFTDRSAVVSLKKHERYEVLAFYQLTPLTNRCDLCYVTAGCSSFVCQCHCYSGGRVIAVCFFGPEY